MKKIVTSILATLAAQLIFATGHTITITTANLICFGDSSGAAVANVSGGVGPFSYLWSNGATVATNLNLAAGTYTCTVTDNNDLSTATSSVTITEPLELTSTISSVDASCGLANGSATVLVTGGSPAYTYLWATSQIGSTATGLSAGLYTVTITDVNGCTQTNSAVVNNISGPVINLTATNMLCFGGSDGKITVNITSAMLITN